MCTLVVINKYFQLQNYMTNKTVGSVVWNSTALLCHSSGCDITLKMIKEKPNMFTVRNDTFIISYLIHFSTSILGVWIVTGCIVKQE